MALLKKDTKGQESHAIHAVAAKPNLGIIVVLLVTGLVVAVSMLFSSQIIKSENGTLSVDTTPSSIAGAVKDAAGKGEAPLSTFTATSSSDDKNRAQNIKIAAKAVNGTVIQPGETFSFNALVGDSSNNPEYCYASAIDGTDVIEERGGGICQVSSAIYAAAIQAGLAVTERHPHSVAQSYASLGMDATVSYGTLDLKIYNNYDVPLELRVATEGETVTASFYGITLPDGTAITITSQVEDTIEEKDGKGNTTTYYVIASYKVTTENGAITSKDLLSIDTYQISAASTVVVSSNDKTKVK